MAEPETAARINSLLPKDWWNAPGIWRKQDPDGFWIFFVVNFFFGALGIWLPLVNALVGGHTTFCQELYKLFTAGGFYMYAVPLLAATVGVVFASLKQETTELSRGTKFLFSFTAMIIFVVCAVFLQIQVLGPTKSKEWINFALQFVVSLVTVLAALYMHALIQNERGSPQSDMQNNAADLSSRVQTAAVTAADFQ